MTIQSSSYKTGDADRRPWGSYVVTGVGKTNDGEDFCEKSITVQPGQVLSLQSHKLRREFWKVEEGILTVICDREYKVFEPGQSISIPQGAIHCMANLGKVPCVVTERQEGICREDDIIRYLDAYGRGTVDAGGETAEISVSLYRRILEEIDRNNG